MNLDKAKLFAGLRPLLGGSLSQETVDAINGILNAFDQHGDGDPRKLASIFGNMRREVGEPLLPVREGDAKTDAEARAYVARQGYAYAKPTQYGGQVAYGRGQIQNTWAYNYEKMDTLLGLHGKLLANFDLALDPVISPQIGVIGMMQGVFTGKKLGDYFNNAKTDWMRARETVNGLDHASEVATYSLNFYHAIQAAIIPDAPKQAAPASGFWAGLLDLIAKLFGKA